MSVKVENLEDISRGCSERPVVAAEVSEVTGFVGIFVFSVPSVESLLMLLWKFAVSATHLGLTLLNAETSSTFLCVHTS